jgi:AcrR family transcriptional regulator
MARPARFTDRDLLQAAAEVAATHGPTAATIQAIAKAAGAPTGSLYHRFASRDVLLGTLWLDLVGRFQAGWIEAMEAGDTEAAALHTPNWVRSHATEARLLLLHRREDFLAGDWPPDLAERAAHVNDRAGGVLRAFTRAELGDDLPATVRRVRFALVQIPYAAVRPYLEAGQPPPPDLDALVLTASQAILDETPSGLRPRAQAPSGLRPRAQGASSP